MPSKAVDGWQMIVDRWLSSTSDGKNNMTGDGYSATDGRNGTTNVKNIVTNDGNNAPDGKISM